MKQILDTLSFIKGVSHNDMNVYIPAAECAQWKMALLAPYNLYSWRSEEKRKKVNSVKKKYWSDTELQTPKTPKYQKYWSDTELQKLQNISDNSLKKINLHITVKSITIYFFNL